MSRCKPMLKIFFTKSPYKYSLLWILILWKKQNTLQLTNQQAKTSSKFYPNPINSKMQTKTEMTGILDIVLIQSSSPYHRQKTRHTKTTKNQNKQTKKPWKTKQNKAKQTNKNQTNKEEKKYTKPSAKWQKQRSFNATILFFCTSCFKRNELPS